MNRLFIDTAGISGEDLTTEILRIILTEEEFAPFQKLFYNRFLSKKEFKSTHEFIFEVQSQNSFEEGRPDLLIYNDNEVYCLENKFYAEFSSEDQLFRYRNLLRDNKKFIDCEIKKVFLLTVKKRQSYYESLVEELLKRLPDGEKKFSDLFYFIFWEDILELWKSDEYLVNALNDYIYHFYIKEINFSSEDIVLIKDKNIPNLLEKLYQLTNQVRNEIAQRKFQPTSISSSYQWWGFYIDLDNVKAWFGFGLNLWKMEKNFISPFGIQIQKNSIPSTFDLDKMRNDLESLNFEYDSNLYWLKRYPVTETELSAESLTNMLVSDLKQLKTLFSESKE